MKSSTQRQECFDVRERKKARNGLQILPRTLKAFYDVLQRKFHDLGTRNAQLTQSTECITLSQITLTQNPEHITLSWITLTWNSEGITSS